VMGHALAFLGRFEESISILEAGAANTKRAPWMLSYLGHALASSGQSQRALEIIAELADAARQPVDIPFYRALVWAGLNEVEQTLRCLDQAYAERHVRMIWLRSDETFRGLRDHPHFQDLIRKIGLPAYSKTNVGAE